MSLRSFRSRTISGVRVGAECELVDGDVGERDGVADEEVVVLPAVDARDLAPERVGVVNRLEERVLHALPLPVDVPKPRPVLALDPAALDLEADDPVLGMAEHEVDLAILRPSAGRASSSWPSGTPPIHRRAGP